MDQIRLATLADARAIATIHVEGWRAAYQGIVPTELMASRTVESRTADFEEAIRNATAIERFWLVERDAQPAAFAYTRAGLDADIPNAGELKLFYTVPALRGSGVGLPLFEHAIADLTATNMEPYLYTFRDNAAARAWYEKRGWRYDGVTAPWSDRGEYPELIEVRYRPARQAASTHGSRGTHRLPATNN
jgi:GNAT superfamily N-acetyltransferase